MSSSKFYAVFPIVFLFIFNQPAVAQDAPLIITLKEESTVGKYMNEIPPAGPAIVDINSIIHINIDIASLENEMFRFQGIAGSDERLQQLNELNLMLRGQNEILELIKREFSDNKKPALEAYNELAQKEIDFLEKLSAPVYNELNTEEMQDKYLEYIETDGKFFIVFVIDFLTEKADKLRNSLMENLNVDGKTDSSLMVYFRLGAFLKNKSGGRPVHVEHFDDISPDSYSEIARFSPPVSDEVKKAIGVTRQLNDSIQNNTNQTIGYFKQVVKTRADNLLPSASSRKKLKEEYLSSLSALSSLPETRPAAQVLLDNELSLNRVERLYVLAADSYKAFADNFPEGIFNDGDFDKIFDDLEQLVTTAYEKFNEDVNLFRNIPDALVADDEKPGLERLLEVDNSYKDYVQSAKEDISGVKAIFTDIKNLLDPFRKSHIKNEEFTEKVFRFTAGRIPPTGYIELKTIGERKAGDEILIKATLERGSTRSNPNYEQKELFRRYITMDRIAAHVKMSGSLALANPYNRDNQNIALTNNYQFAPSYGIFLKWGSRKSKFYNDFLNFGTGLGFTSPDFNLDGTPEFGAGVMATALRDLFNLGWGWNFGLDAPYFFMGFNIPFTGFSLQSSRSDFIAE